MRQRRTLLVTVSAIALTAGTALLLRRPRTARAAAEAPARFVGTPIDEGHVDTAEATRRFLLYFIVPVWFAAGIADWLCHRATDIEGTTGPKESLLHLLMLVEVSVPVLAGLFLEITSPVLALMIAAFLVHTATALWDVSYAVTRRDVTPIEQHVHSYLEMVPLMAISFLAVLHWDALLGLVGLGAAPREQWTLRLKCRPLPSGYVATLLGGNVLVEWLPYGEELWRTLRAAARRRAARSRLPAMMA